MEEKKRVKLLVLNDYLKFDRKIYQIFGVSIGRPIKLKSVLYFIVSVIFEVIVYITPIVGNILKMLPDIFLLLIPVGIAYLLSDVRTEGRNPIAFFRSVFFYQLRRIKKVGYIRGREIAKPARYQFTGYVTVNYSDRNEILDTLQVQPAKAGNRNRKDRRQLNRKKIKKQKIVPADTNETSKQFPVVAMEAKNSNDDHIEIANAETQKVVENRIEKTISSIDSEITEAKLNSSKKSISFSSNDSIKNDRVDLETKMDIADKEEKKPSKNRRSNIAIRLSKANLFLHSFKNSIRQSLTKTGTSSEALPKSVHQKEVTPLNTVAEEYLTDQERMENILKNRPSLEELQAQIKEEKRMLKLEKKLDKVMKKGEW